MKPLHAVFPCLVVACTPASQSRTHVVYGQDDRIGLEGFAGSPEFLWADSTALLIRTEDLSGRERVTLRHAPLGEKYGLCPDERFANEPSAGFCTAFLVEPDLIATAGHCIDERDAEGNRLPRAEVCEGFAAVFGYHAEAEVDAGDVYHCKEILTAQFQQSNGPDFAWVRLDRPVAGRKPLPIRRQGIPEERIPLALVGHPVGLPTKIAAGNASTVSSSSEKSFRFGAFVDAFEVNSGSPVINRTTGVVEGILVGGWADYVRRGSCRKAFVCEEGCEAADVMRIDQAFATLPQGRPSFEREVLYFPHIPTRDLAPRSTLSIEVRSDETRAPVDLGVELALDIPFAADVSVALTTPQGSSLELVKPGRFKGSNVDEVIGLEGLPILGLPGLLPSSARGTWTLHIENGGDAPATVKHLFLRLRY